MLCEEEVVKSGSEGGRSMSMLICFGQNMGPVLQRLNPEPFPREEMSGFGWANDGGEVMSSTGGC